jgi:hypothetical protein
MALIDHYDFIMKVIGDIEQRRMNDTPMNELAFVFKEGHEQGINDALNELRKEL